MLGETVVVGVGGGTLLRPRSADNLARLAPASSIPALDDLTESEVFVGDEEEDLALSGEVQQGEEIHVEPSFQQNPSSPEHSSPVRSCDVASPDLLSPTSPTPTTNLVITYHEDGLRLPLDAVKEEVEAEALEEASMILSSGPGSLSHASLASSIISNNSLEDATLSSRTDTFDTVVEVPSIAGNMTKSTPSSPPSASEEPSPRNTPPLKNTPARPANRDAARVSGTSARTSPTSPRGSSGRSSSPKGTSGRSSSPRGPSGRSSSPRGLSGRSSSPRGLSGRSSSPRGLSGRSSSPRGLSGRSSSPRGLSGRSSSPRGLSGRSSSPRGSSGRSSPRTSSDSPRTPERRRRAGAVGSPRGENSRGSTPRAPAMRTTPRGTIDKNKDDKKTPYKGSSRSSAAGIDRKPSTSRGHDTSKKDTEKASSHSRYRTTEKDRTDDSKTSTLGRKKKPDSKDVKADTEVKYGTLGRRRKESKTEKEEVADKYGTLGRCRKAKESGDTKDDNKDRLMTKDNKNTLDMYATLPRRKAREMSARWREQNAADEDGSRPALRRTKSIGKTESSSNSRGRTSVMTTSLPSSALTGLGRSRSPRGTHRDTKTVPASASNTRKEKTIICMETGVQTSLTGGDVCSALRALSRQNSVATEEEEDEGASEAKPHVTIVREVEIPEVKPNRQHVEVQVELAWRLGDGELPEHVRRLTDEHTRLQTEHARARARLEEMESIRGELEKLKITLKEERSEKEEVQNELERTSQRVRDMLTSMEGVEQEFNSRGDSLIELETQLHQSADIHVQMQDKLNQYEEYTLKIKKDLDKSVAAQKTLLQQVQDLENEGREIADFMSEEKNALSECLREAETELARLREESKQLSVKFNKKDEEARHMVRLADEYRSKYMGLQSEMCSIQSRARDMMVCQGAEVSGAAVSLANLMSRLQTLIGKLIQDYSITDADLEMIVTPSESDSSASSTNGTPERKSPYKVAVRTPSPRKTASFITALLNAMRGGPRGKLSQLTEGHFPCNGSKQITEGRNSPEGSESHEVVEHDGNVVTSCSSVSLADQVTEVDILLTQFLKVCCVLKNDTDNRMTEIEDENDRLCTQIRSQQQVIDQQHADYENVSRSEARAKRELMVVSRDLEVANQNLNKFYQADYDIQVKKLEDEVERLGTTVRHLEALHTEKEKQLADSLASLSAAQGQAPPNHVSEATHRQEVATLNDKVASLRQSVIERDRRIGELSERHSQDLASIREAQIDSQRSNRRLITTVDHVLKTLESIPDIVSGSSTLKQLFSTLAAAEKSNQHQQQQNGNANSQNGFNNTVNNKDLNANPQQIITSGINNKKILPTIKSETHL